MSLLGFAHLLKTPDVDSEVWFDSSPTLYRSIKQKLLVQYPDSHEVIEKLLSDNFLPSDAGVRGATTNPRLISQAVLKDQPHWHDVVRKLPAGLNTEEKTRRLYDQVIVEGARLLQPLWRLSKKRAGWLSAQIEGGHWMDEQALVARALALAALAPNIMIKVPGSEQGYRAIEHLVAKGCSINNTFCFSVSQLDACLKAIHVGRQRARANGVRTDGAQYVVSFMIGRLGDQAQLDRDARDKRIELAPTDRRWAELAVYQAMQALMRRRQTPARLLLCSIRTDLDPRGREQCWHLQRTGADTTVYTLTPDILEFLIRREQSGLPVRPANEWVRVPDRVLNRLIDLPYFQQAYFEGGLAPGGFAHQPAFITAGNDVRQGLERLHGFVAATEASAGRLLARARVEDLA